MLMLMQTEPGSIPGLGEALAKISSKYAELYWDSNESIPRPLGGQEVSENGFIFTPRYSIFSGDHGLLVIIFLKTVCMFSNRTKRRIKEK